MCESPFSLAYSLLIDKGIKNKSPQSCKTVVFFPPPDTEFDCVWSALDYMLLEWQVPKRYLCSFHFNSTLSFLLLVYFYPVSSSHFCYCTCSAPKPDVAVKPKRGENHLKYVCWNDGSSAIFCVLLLWWVEFDVFPDQSIFQERSFQFCS